MLGGDALLLSLIRYIKGYLRISIIGYSPERFLNLCSHHHIYIWGLKPSGNRYEMYMSVAGFRKLKPIIKKTKTKVVILKRYGLPFFLHKYRKRKVFFAGAVGSVFAIYLMSCIIWNIHIEGNFTRTDETILEYLETQGVIHGMRKSKLDCAKIVRDIRKEFHDIIWVSASIEGTRLLIQVKENTDTMKEQEVNKGDFGTDLIASQDGKVVKIVTRSGMPKVKEGDRVKKGDVLVSGRIEILNDAKEVTEYQYQSADADVYIQSSFPYEDHISHIYEKKDYTDRKRTCLFVQMGDYILETGLLSKAYKNADIFMVENRCKLGEHFYLPISYGVKTCKEYEWKKEKRSKEEIQFILTKEFQRFCKDLEKKGVEIVGKDVKIYNENQSASAKGKITLIQKAEERRNTELIHPKGVN